MIALIAGKNLKSAINAYGKQAATFAEKMHQLAASAVAHLNAHNELCYVQQLYDATPLNFRPVLREYIVNFGKVKFNAIDAKTKAPVNKFELSTGKKLPENAESVMLTVTPSEFAKAAKSGNAADPKKYDAKAKLESLQRSIETMMEDFDKHGVAETACTKLETARDNVKAALTAIAKANIAAVKATPAIVAPVVETVKNPGRKGKAKLAIVGNENAETAPLANVG